MKLRLSQLYGEVLEAWRIKVDDPRFDVMVGVDEGQNIGFA